jgi:hypothetical protein
MSRDRGALALQLGLLAIDAPLLGQLERPLLLLLPFLLLPLLVNLRHHTCM